MRKLVLLLLLALAACQYGGAPYDVPVRDGGHDGTNGPDAAGSGSDKDGN